MFSPVRFIAGCILTYNLLDLGLQNICGSGSPEMRIPREVLL